MRKTVKLLLTGALCIAACVSLTASYEAYFLPAEKGTVAAPDEQGFIRRWLLLEPIGKPNRSNTVFTDSYVRENLTKEYYKDQFTMIPKDGQKVKATVEKQVQTEPEGPRRSFSFEPPKIETVVEKLQWHAVDSKLFNVKLYRFATGLEKERYGVIFHAVTIIDCPEDIKDVRLSVGSNSASLWWLDGEEVLILSGDRRMVMDDCQSNRLTLEKGRHVLRGAVINGPGMSDFCVRFVDAEGAPVKNISVTLE